MKKDFELKKSYHLLHPKLALLVAAKQNAKQNVMTVAWATPVCDDPPIICVAIGKESLTAGMIRKTKEFTVNVPSNELKEAVWLCGTRSGRKLDKAKAAGLTYATSKKISALIISECIGHLECKVRETIDCEGCWLFVADVLAAYAEEKFIKDNMWNKSAKLLLHFGGNVFGAPEIR